jgi:hypothetical protein
LFKQDIFRRATENEKGQNVTILILFFPDLLISQLYLQTYRQNKNKMSDEQEQSTPPTQVETKDSSVEGKYLTMSINHSYYCF